MLQDEILFLLEQQRGEVVTGGELARKLAVSRTAIWKAIGALREQGSEIESIPNSGYRLAQESDGLSQKSIQGSLRTKILGQSLEIKRCVSSTNSYIKGLDTSSLPDGHAVLADEQSGGRGRMGRTFHSPAGQGVYLSVLLKPPVPLADTPFLTICAAVTVCRAVEAVFGFQPSIKWVNDIFYKGKKLCGILTEAFISAEMRTVDYAVVGMGVNTGSILPEVAEVATSTQLISGKRGLRNQLAAEILGQLESVYTLFLQGSQEEILSAYTERMFITGRIVNVIQPNGCYQARVQGVDVSGGLIVQKEDGSVCVLNSGEVRLTGEDTIQ